MAYLCNEDLAYPSWGPSYIFHDPLPDSYFPAFLDEVPHKTLPDLLLATQPDPDGAFDDLQMTTSQLHEHLKLYVNKKFVSREFKNASGALRKLATCTSATRQKLRALWSSTAKFSHDRAHCRGRTFSRRCLYLKQYLELVLDFDASDPKLRPDGTLDCTLHDTEQFLEDSKALSLSEVNFDGSAISLRILGDLFAKERREAQSKLLQLSAYEELLETEYQTVESQLQQLPSIEDTLDEEQRQKEGEQRQLEIYMERLDRFIRKVAIRFQIFLEFLLILCKFSGLPDSEQPRCMTMPWNIRPALIVLWGVCWMFYPPQKVVSPVEILLSNAGEGAQFSTTEHPRSTIDDIPWGLYSDQQLNSLLGIDANTPQPSTSATEDMFGFSSLFNTPRSGLPDERVYPPNPENSLPPFHQATTIDDGFIQERVQQTCDSGDRSSPEDSSQSLFSTVEETAPSPMQTTSGYRPVTNPKESGILLLESGSLPPRTSATPTTRATDPMPTLRPPTILEQPQFAPQYSEDDISCIHLQCSDLKFNRVSDWKKHNDRIHNRHMCEVFGCTQSFGSKGDLNRHKQTKHNQLPQHKLLRCPESGCKYSRTPHFKRKDNLTDHLERMHNYKQADANVRAIYQARSQAAAHLNPQAGLQSTYTSKPRLTSQVVCEPASNPPPATATARERELSSERMEDVLPGPSKRPRLGCSSPDPDETLPSTVVSHTNLNEEAEFWKRKAARSEERTEAMLAQYVSLRTENDSLKMEVKRLKDNEDSLIAILANRKL